MKTNIFPLITEFSRNTNTSRITGGAVTGTAILIVLAILLPSAILIAIFIIRRRRAKIVLTPSPSLALPPLQLPPNITREDKKDIEDPQIPDGDITASNIHMEVNWAYQEDIEYIYHYTSTQQAVCCIQ